MSVTVPLVVPLSTTPAPGTGSPDASRIVPVMVTGPPFLSLTLALVMIMLSPSMVKATLTGVKRALQTLLMVSRSTLMLTILPASTPLLMKRNLDCCLISFIAFVNVTLSSFSVILVSACGRAFILTVNAKSRRKQSRPRIFCRILCLFFMFCEIWFEIISSLFKMF